MYQGSMSHYHNFASICTGNGENSATSHSIADLLTGLSFARCFNLGHHTAGYCTRTMFGSRITCHIHVQLCCSTHMKLPLSDFWQKSFRIPEYLRNSKGHYVDITDSVQRILIC